MPPSRRDVLTVAGAAVLAAVPRPFPRPRPRSDRDAAIIRTALGRRYRALCDEYGREVLRPTSTAAAAVRAWDAGEAGSQPVEIFAGRIADAFERAARALEADLDRVAGVRIIRQAVSDRRRQLVAEGIPAPAPGQLLDVAVRLWRGGAVRVDASTWARAIADRYEALARGLQ